MIMLLKFYIFLLFLFPEKPPVYIERLFSSEVIRAEWFLPLRENDNSIIVKLDPYLQQKLGTERSFIEYKLPNKTVYLYSDKVLFTEHIEKYIEFSVIEEGSDTIYLSFQIVEVVDLMTTKSIAKGNFSISYRDGVWDEGRGEVVFNNY